MIRKIIVFAFSVLLLPSLSHAQCAYESANESANESAHESAHESTNETSAQCSDAKAVEVKQSSNSTAITTTDASSARNESASATGKGSFSSRNNKGRAERQFPRFEPADPRDTVLSSEICVYSSATYTYTCR